MNIPKFIAIAKQTELELLESMYDFLKRHYSEVVMNSGMDYVFAQGQSSVCLVAHLDTVFSSPPRKFYRSKFNKDIISSPQGLGADDRAGIYAIIDLINKGLRPSIILTTEEEFGGIGARKLITDYPGLAPITMSCMIQLDRQGKDESVYYDCGNDSFETFINGFGFHSKNGSFSDISILAPEWDIAAVNLSVGYKKEHSYKEFLNCAHLDATIDKVKDIILSEPSLYDYQGNPDMEFWKGCFTCTAGNCVDCHRLAAFESERGPLWRQKELW